MTGIVAAGLLLLGVTPGRGGTATAHHSFAQFDASKCKTISGTVRTFAWGYPHTWLWLNVQNATGGVDVWGFEGEPPSNLAQEGWSKTSVVKGDKVTVAYNPLRDGRNGGAFAMLKRADGSLLHGALGKRSDCRL
jgi:hypothetical protein